MSDQVLLTTTVGSFGKPDYLQKARNANARGKLGEAELTELERRATEEWVRRQERLDLDILVDGEMYRGDMVAYFAERLEGFRLGGLVRSYGNRYYHKPIIASPVRRPKPMTVDWFRFTQSLTDRPVKGMLTGPYTLLDWSYNEAYRTRRDAALALAEVVRQEAEDLQAAGARYIQIDEPAIHARPEEIDIAIEAMGVVTQNLKAKTISHICYGDFAAIYPVAGAVRSRSVHEGARHRHRRRALARDGVGRDGGGRDPQGAALRVEGAPPPASRLRPQDADGRGVRGEMPRRRRGDEGRPQRARAAGDAGKDGSLESPPWRA